MAEALRRSARIGSQPEPELREFSNVFPSQKKPAKSTASKATIRKGRPKKKKCSGKKKKSSVKPENEFLVSDLMEMPTALEKNDSVPESPSVFARSSLRFLYDGFTQNNPVSVQLGVPIPVKAEPEENTDEAPVQSEPMQSKPESLSNKDNYVDHILSQWTPSLGSERSTDAATQCCLPEMKTTGTNTIQTNQAVYISKFDVLDKLFLTNLSHRLHISPEYLIGQAEDVYLNSFNPYMSSHYTNEDVEMQTAEQRLGLLGATPTTSSPTQSEWGSFAPDQPEGVQYSPPLENMDICFDHSNDVLFYY